MGEQSQRRACKGMHRHNITLTDDQWATLQEEALRRGLRGASAVVQAHAASLSRKHARQDARSAG